MSEANIVETIALAMRESKSWPVVFGPGSAESLARSAITALEANGYAIVPTSPTPEMAKVGLYVAGTGSVLGAWDAMISTGKAKA